MEKPIKRAKQILQLSKDHHYTLLFCWKIRQGLNLGVAAERIKKYVVYFWSQHMQAHFREEEEILFIPVKDEKVQKAINEHRQIKELVNSTLQSSVDEASNKLLQLADLIDAHVRYEERVLFPYLEKTLTFIQLENIGKQLPEHKMIKDDYTDEFWIKKP